MPRGRAGQGGEGGLVSPPLPQAGDKRCPQQSSLWSLVPASGLPDSDTQRQAARPHRPAFSLSRLKILAAAHSLWLPASATQTFLGCPSSPGRLQAELGQTPGETMGREVHENQECAKRRGSGRPRRRRGEGGQPPSGAPAGGLRLWGEITPHAHTWERDTGQPSEEARPARVTRRVLSG